MKGTRKPSPAPEPAKRRPGRPRREEEKVRLAVLLPPELKKELRKRAVDEDRDASDIVADAVRVYLRRNPSR